jgi:hypothetical protein
MLQLDLKMNGIRSIACDIYGLFECPCDHIYHSQAVIPELVTISSRKLNDMTETLKRRQDRAEALQ